MILAQRYDLYVELERGKGRRIMGLRVWGNETIQHFISTDPAILATFPQESPTCVYYSLDPRFDQRDIVRWLKCAAYPSKRIRIVG
jgi:hypothetical protein